MKVNVYLLQKKGDWSAWLTLCPDVDYAYWFGKRSAWAEAECAWFWKEELPLGQAAEVVGLWKERAVRSRGNRIASLSALWDGSGRVDASSGSESRGYGSWGRLSEADAVGMISNIIEEVKEAGNGSKRKGVIKWAWNRGTSGKKEQMGKASMAAECYEGGRYGRDTSAHTDSNGMRRAMAGSVQGDRIGKSWPEARNGLRDGSGEPRANAERAHGYGIDQTRPMSGSVQGDGIGKPWPMSGSVQGDGSGKPWPEARNELRDGREGSASSRRSVVRWSMGDGRRVMDAERWSHVAAIAKLAAELLQGRALLSGEARALLAGAAVPGAEADWSEAIQLAALLGQVRLSGAVAAPAGKRADARRRLRCLRCGSGEAHLRRAACLACGRDCSYCEACILMGRSRECELLIRGMYDSPVWKEKGLGRWKALRQQPMQDRLGKWGLSPAQRDATARALHFLEERPVKETTRGSALLRLQSRFGSALSRFVSPDRLSESARDSGIVRENTRRSVPRVHAQEAGAQESESDGEGTLPSCQVSTPSNPTPREEGTYPDRRFLIWAVTGAGKTEMVFPLVESIVSRGGRALIASPRRDVVLELDPRIRRAFPKLNVVTLYGGSEQRWDRGEITLSTTHQLLRFHEAFDLVIIDEIDAFPYHGDPMLHYAADKSRLPGAPKLLLSATPPRNLQLEARRGKLAHARVPVRYHRHPLPVPKLLRAPSVRQLLAKGRVPLSLMNALRQSLGRGAQIFLFVQRISESEPMAALLRKQLKAGVIEATSSQDPDRTDKVIRFRNTATRMLVTTTILERGVTVPRSDVFILDADGKLFDEASLVQMAGRAGRSSDDPAGKVYFVGPARTVPQLRAVRHIRSMNRIAAKQGFLLPARIASKREEQ